MFEGTTAYGVMLPPTVLYTEDRPEKSQFKRSIVVNLRKGEDGYIVVTSPDLPAVVTQGETEQQATRNALEAVMAVLEELGQHGEIALTVRREY